MLVVQLTDELDSRPLLFQTERVAWHRPTDLNSLLELKHRFNDARLVVGNTEVGESWKSDSFCIPSIENADFRAELRNRDEVQETVVSSAHRSNTRS